MAINDELLTYADIVKITKMSKSTLWRLRKEGYFPQPIKFGVSPQRKNIWKLSSIEKWMDSL